MSSLRFLPLLPIVGALLLTGALPRHSRTSTAPSSALPPPAPVTGAAADPGATEALDQALDALAPARIGWLETVVWQRVRLPEGSFQADGRYLLAPDRRFRLELHTRQGKTEGDLLVVRDDDVLWEGWRVGGTGWKGVNCIDVRQVLETLGNSAASREELLQARSFRGVTPLLRDLRERLTWVRRATIQLGGEPCLELTGVWRPGVLAKLLPGGQPWPNSLPTLCRLYLDAASLWPRRVEWWGPSGRAAGKNAGGTLRLLAEMELRTPRFDQAIPDEVCASEFRFDPGTTTVKDRTDEFIAEFAMRK